MDNFNKIISFVLGLIVVVVFLLIATGKLKVFNSKSGLFNVSRGNTVASPTPTAKPTIVAQNNEGITPTDEPKITSTPKVLPTNNPAKDIKTIPSTGASTDLLIATLIMLAVGLIFKKATV